MTKSPTKLNKTRVEKNCSCSLNTAFDMSDKSLSIPEISFTCLEKLAQVNTVVRINDGDATCSPFIENISLDEIKQDQLVSVSISSTASRFLVTVNVGRTWKTVHGYLGLEGGGIANVTRIPSGPHTVGFKSTSGKFWTATYSVSGDVNSATVGPIVLSPD